MNTKLLVATAPLALAAAACGTQSAHLTAAAPRHQALAPASAPKAKAPAATTTPGCTTAQLRIRLGTANGAAGSVYEPLVFTNAGTASCTLYGYPGVSFVAPKTGSQVGAAASRNAQHPSATVTLAPGGSASATVQVADHFNFPPGDCNAAAVSGFRVYPPGQKSAAYVPFATNSQACSSSVGQLSVMAVVSGTTGM